MRLDSSKIICMHDLKEGCHQMFSLVFETFWDQIYHYQLKKTKDVDSAIELTQQVLVKLWRYRASMDEELTIEQQVFQKCKQVFIDWLRSEAKKRIYQVELDNSFDIADDHIPEFAYSLKHDVYKAIQTLPPKRKEIFELKHIHGYSYKEIAENLGISVKTVDNQLLKANIHLRKILHTYMLLVFTNYMIK